MRWLNRYRIGTFCTGGSDGVVAVWDPINRKRIRQYPKKPSSIAALAFNGDGKYLAIASSYCYEEGEKEYHPSILFSLLTLPSSHAPDTIFIKTIEDAEIKPKSVV